MKKFLLLPIIHLLLLSCQKGENRAGMLSTVNIRLEYSDSITKSPQAVSEGEISNLTLLLYNSSGKLAGSRYFEENLDGITMEIPSGQKHSIYIVANSGDYSKIGSLVDEEAARGLCFTFENGGSIINRDGTIPMSGYLPPRSFTDGETASISLTRLLSKFRIILNKEELAPSVSKFEIKEIRLRNINRRVGFFSESRAETLSDIIDAGVSATGDDLKGIFSSGADFYLPENLQGDLLQGNIDERGHIPPEPYSSLCSYVEILVSYLSDTQYDEELTYRYYIHDGRLLDNFDVKRNRMYTCTTLFYNSGINEQTWRIETSSLKKLVTSVTISPQSHRFTALGESIQMKATVTPYDAENISVTWKSSNPDIATVDNNGVVTSVSDGTCTITATANDISGKYGSARIIVDSYVFPSSISVSPSSATLYTGDAVTFTATVSPANANNKGVIWSSSNPDIASVSSSGIATAISKGECTITATATDNGISASARVQVKEKTFTVGDIPVLYPGYNTPFTIQHTAEPYGTPAYSISRISGENSLELTSNLLNGYYNGSASSGIVGRYTLSGTLNGITRERSVQVNIGSISIAAPSHLVAGSGGQCTVLSKSPSDIGVTWSSSDPSIASIDGNGYIIGHKGGNVTITARCSSGAYSTSSLTVTEPYIEISISDNRLINTNIVGTSVSGYPSSASLSLNTNINNSNIEWEAFDKDGDKILLSSIFTITSSGIITPVNNASGAYRLRAKSGSTCSNEVVLKVYLYLEYDMYLDIHSYDKTKEEITFDYEVESRWCDKSWEALNRNSQWVWIFTSSPNYKAVQLDNVWGYAWISREGNALNPISSIYYNSYKYNSLIDSNPENNPLNYITVSGTLKDLNGNTATGSKGIAIEDPDYGYFYVREGQLLD